MAMMTVIKVVPGEIEIGKDPQTGEPIKGGFKKCLISAIDGYPPAGKGISKIREATGIVDKIEKAEEKLTLTKNEYNVLCAAIEACPYIPRVGRLYEKEGYFEAVLDPESKAA